MRVDASSKTSKVLKVKVVILTGSLLLCVCVCIHIHNIYIYSLFIHIYTHTYLYVWKEKSKPQQVIRGSEMVNVNAISISLMWPFGVTLRGGLQLSDKTLEPVIHSVTTPGTEQSAAPETGKAANEKSACFSVAKEEREKSSPRSPSSSQSSESPIIQEPEEPELHQDDVSPRRTSLVIVESTDEQPEKLGSGYEEESLEKVNTNFSSK